MSLSETNGVIRLAVSDNGKDLTLVTVVTTNARITWNEGTSDHAQRTFDIDSASGKGTKVKIEIPV